MVKDDDEEEQIKIFNKSQQNKPSNGNILKYIGSETTDQPTTKHQASPKPKVGFGLIEKRILFLF